MRTSTYTAWDRALDGRLTELLLELRAGGSTYDQIVDILRDEHDVHVSRTTVLRWVGIAEHETPRVVTGPADERYAAEG